jgi:hypothetical protein
MIKKKKDAMMKKKMGSWEIKWKDEKKKRIKLSFFP